MDLGFTFEKNFALWLDLTEFQKIRAGSGSQNITVRSSLLSEGSVAIFVVLKPNLVYLANVWFVYSIWLIVYFFIFWFAFSLF